MRMSVRKTDPGYHKRAHWFKPYLNGKEVDSCFTADDIEGFCDVHAKDFDGRFIVENGDIRTIRHRGKVEILKAK